MEVGTWSPPLSHPHPKFQASGFPGHRSPLKQGNDSGGHYNTETSGIVTGTGTEAQLGFGVARYGKLPCVKLLSSENDQSLTSLLSMAINLSSLLLFVSFLLTGIFCLYKAQLTVLLLTTKGPGSAVSISSPKESNLIANSSGQGSSPDPVGRDYGGRGRR